MPREIVTIEVGQCGLQTGSRFWELALQEHQQHSQTHPPASVAQSQSLSLSSLYDDPSTTFFDVSSTGALSARAVLIDTELGVINAINRSKHAALYQSGSDTPHTHANTVSDVSGAGNNFAHGHYVYGPQLEDSFANAINSAVERCDSLQSFLLIHSTGGGTGSGLGSYVNNWLADHYPAIYRLTVPVLPSVTNSDVVTWPYNTTLSLAHTMQSADAILAVDNQALIDIVTRHTAATSTGSSTVGDRRVVGGGYRDLNLLCASMLSSLTAGMRFPGELNVDLNDLIMNLIPQPSHKFLMPGLAPIHTLFKATAAQGIQDVRMRTKMSTGAPPSSERGAHPVPSPTQLFHTLAMAKQVSQSRLSLAAPSFTTHDSAKPAPSLALTKSTVTNTAASALKSVDAIFSSALAKSNQLFATDLSKGVFLTASLLCRGSALSYGLIQRQTALLRPSMTFTYDSASIKLGLCSVSGIDSPLSVLSLSNNTSITTRLDGIVDCTRSLFHRRAHWHHYYECGLEEEQMTEAMEVLRVGSGEYKRVENV